MTIEAHIRQVNEDYFGVPLGAFKYPLERWKDRDFTTDHLLFNARRGGNLAVRVGLTRRGVQVLCIDRDDRRRGSWEFLRRHGLQRANCQVETASGNWHVWLRLEHEIADLRTRIKLAGLPIDIKANGIVVFPYSRIGTGTYEFRVHKGYKSPEELTVLPASLLELLTQKPAEPQPKPLAPVPLEQEGRLLRYVDKIERSVQGSAGSRACIVACLKILTLVRGDLARAWPLLVHYNRTRCEPPWDEEVEGGPDSLKRKLNEALRYWSQHPRANERNGKP